MRRTATACMFLFLVACGSSDEGGLFGTPRAASGGTTSGGTTAVGGSAGSTGGVGGTLQTGGTGAVGSGGESGSAGSGATGGDASGGSAGGAATGGDGGSGGSGATGGNPAAGTISCGGVNNCARPENFCCVFLSGSSFPTPTCQANAAPCLPGSEVYCDGPEDCINGTVCCGQLVNSRFGQAYNDLKCRPEQECVYAQQRRLICGDQKCPSGLSCKPSSLLPNINFCSPN